MINECTLSTFIETITNEIWSEVYEQSYSVNQTFEVFYHTF